MLVVAETVDEVPEPVDELEFVVEELEPELDVRVDADVVAVDRVVVVDEAVVDAAVVVVDEAVVDAGVVVVVDAAVVVDEAVVDDRELVVDGGEAVVVDAAEVVVEADDVTEVMDVDVDVTWVDEDGPEPVVAVENDTVGAVREVDVRLELWVVVTVWVPPPDGGTHTAPDAVVGAPEGVPAAVPEDVGEAGGAGPPLVAGARDRTSTPAAAHRGAGVPAGGRPVRTRQTLAA